MSFGNQETFIKLVDCLVLFYAINRFGLNGWYYRKTDDKTEKMCGETEIMVKQEILMVKKKNSVVNGDSLQ